MAATQQQLKTAELLGTDIALTDAGDFTTAYRNGYTDRASISGRQNLRQALLSRLKSVPKLLQSRLPGDLPMHPTYGIGVLSIVSQPYSEVLQQAQTLIVSNFAAEPRIKPLDTSNIVFTWDSIQRLLQISISYTTITTQIPENLIFPIYIT